MKFKYIGEPGHDAPEVSTHFGVEFHRGEFVDIDDGIAIAKLVGHPHFVVKDESHTEARADIVDTGKPEAKPVKRRRRKSGGMNANNSGTNRAGDEADWGA